MIQVEQVAENLEQAVQVVHLLRHVYVPVVLITLLLFHGFRGFAIRLLHLVEDLLKLVQESASLRLQFRVVPL